jgi:hypothetical protein
MKSETQIQDRVRLLMVAELDRRVEKGCAKLPHNCIHNYRHSLDARKTVEGEPNTHYNSIEHPRGQTIGLCQLGSEDPETWGGTICEDPLDAAKCPYDSFTPRFTKDELWDHLIEQAKNPEWASANMPEVAALTWVLQTASVKAVQETAKVVTLMRQVTLLEEARESGVYVGKPPAGWFKRLVFKWLGLRVAPVEVPPMLPEATDDPGDGS